MGSPKVLLALSAALIVAAPLRGRADGAIDAWAEWLVSRGTYRGPLVPWPDAVPRPAGELLAGSTWVPVSVHGGPELTEAGVSRALGALERGYWLLVQRGWPLPLPDGGHGGTLDYDVYLVGRPTPAGAEVEHPVTWRDTDSAEAYGWLDPNLDAGELEACALETLAEAGLVGLDPAEAPRLRHASATALVYLATGQHACGDDALEAQAHPERGFFGDGSEGTDATALYLAALSERHDGGGDGRFLRALWELERQASGSASRLHAEPDLAMAVAQALAQAGESDDQLAVDVAVARYFAGPPERRRHATYPVFAALPADAAVPVVEARAYDALPHHLPSAMPALWPRGSAYTRVDTTGAPAGAQLKVWLRGEHGARWSLVAVRLAADGRELGRVEAPARTRVPDAFLPVELPPDTASVLLVVTHLPATPLPPGSTTPPPLPGPRSFRLILNR